MNKKEYVLDYDAGSFYADENGELIFEHEEPYIDLPDGYSVVQDVEIAGIKPLVCFVFEELFIYSICLPLQ